MIPFLSFDLAGFGFGAQQSETSFIFLPVLVSLDDLDKFSKALGFAKAERNTQRKAELLERKQKLKNELEDIKSSVS